MYENNDGAVIAVEPLNPKRSMKPVPQALESFYPGVVPTITAYSDGYPAANSQDEGCSVLNETWRCAGMRGCLLCSTDLALFQ